MFSIAVIFFSIFGPSILLYLAILYFKLPFPQQSLFLIDSPSFQEKSIPSFKSVLIVTAHPDDETIFFAPSILGFSKLQHVKVHLLCLSTGNQDGLGETRRRELLKACKILEIDEERVVILDDEEMQDGQSNLWAPATVARAIEKTIITFGIKTVLTFDGRGVSGHFNHISARAGVGHLIKTSSKLNSSELAIVAYELESVSLIRKYIALGDLLFSLAQISYEKEPLRHTVAEVLVPVQLVFVSEPSKIVQAYNAMRAHYSQLVWFRRLYIIFSRYMSINTFRRINPITG